jgi:hypothetical protein
MVTVGPEEKVATVMAYTYNGVVRGEIIVRESVRVSVWLRTDSAPDFIYFHNAQWIQTFGGPVRSTAYPELLLPIGHVLGFHIAPPAADPLDYNLKDDNRVDKPASIVMGSFVLNGFIRAAAQTDLVTNLQISHSPWMSFYNAEVSSPQLPQMPPMHVPFLLIRPPQVAFVPHRNPEQGAAK